MLYDHPNLRPLPPSSLKIPVLMGSISRFLPHQAMNCSLCYGGWRADVNTAFNYKSNSNRATLHCPGALCTKAQPSYPNTPHRTAGNLRPAIHQDKFTTETETSLVVVSVKVMQRMSRSSFVCVGYHLWLCNTLKTEVWQYEQFSPIFAFLFVLIHIISSNILIEITMIWYYVSTSAYYDFMQNTATKETKEIEPYIFTAESTLLL